MLYPKTSAGATIPVIPCLGQPDSAIKADPFQSLKTLGAGFPVSQVNWPEFPHCPETRVYAGYTDEMLWLNFSVKNDYMRACAVHDQDPVYQDACVEFFMHTGGDYRNFEFNCLGVCLSAIGPDRHNRARLPEAELGRIVRIPSFSREKLPAEGELCDWELTVGIPLSVLGIQKGSTFYGNFYKCGAKTRVLHYLSWAEINTPKPDFHCPVFFPAIQLVK
jgi:hypothetical protein